MPKTSVYEKCDLAAGPTEIRFAKNGPMLTVAFDAVFAEQLADALLRAFIFA
jgi:hypothetical protein